MVLFGFNFVLSAVLSYSFAFLFLCFWYFYICVFLPVCNVILVHMVVYYGNFVNEKNNALHKKAPKIKFAFDATATLTNNETQHIFFKYSSRI